MHLIWVKRFVINDEYTSPLSYRVPFSSSCVHKMLGKTENAGKWEENEATLDACELFQLSEKLALLFSATPLS